MGKTLRVCLAMGGGVALGAFSGASLTEALKLLVLYGKDDENNPYEKVIVDGMSGASAGAIALTIMLKCLIDYKAMIPLLDNGTTEAGLLDELAQDYFDGDRDLAKNHSEIESLKALQLAQKIQYKIWVEELDSLKLYGRKIKKDYIADINDSFALLDRGLLESLAKKYLMKSEGVDINNRILLDENRVLFACSLTNLLPIEVGSSAGNLRKLEENVLKSVGSQNHSELRVVDFVFNEAAIKDKPTDDRWIKFCQNPTASRKAEFNLNEPHAWSTIAASALACGAFPIAFEPVLLKRFQSEFGGENPGSEWPQSFQNIKQSLANSKNIHGTNFKENSFFGEKQDPQLDYESFNFPYMDGGTFNNEPIREAFKMGTFQDFGRDNENTERLVLFVDPIVRADQNHSFKVSSFSSIKKSGDGKLSFNKELSKLFGSVGSILGVLVNQGSVKEEHKMVDIKENLTLRRTIFDYLNINDNLGQTLNVNILTTTFNKISKNLTSNIISMGTRDPNIYFLTEIEKSCKKQGKMNSACLHITKEQMETLKQEIKAKNIGEGDIEKVYDILKLHQPEDRNTFAQAVFKVIIDFSLNTDGKSKAATRAAILPINSNLDTINLPGGEVEAFGGFASLKSRKYAFEYAKLSTLISLREQRDGFRENNGFLIDTQLDNIEKKILNTIEKINFYNESNPYSNDLKSNLFKPSADRIRGVMLKNKLLSFILMKVPFVATSLFGTLALPVYSIISLWNSIFRKSPWRTSGIMNNLIQKGADQVNYLALESVTFSILSTQKLNKKLMIRCEDTGVKKMKALENEFTDFDGNRRFQYLFKVHLLEYIYPNTSMSSRAFSANNASSKLDARYVERLGLSLSDKVRLPKTIDGNLNAADKHLAIQNNYNNIITEMRIDRVNLPFINAAINEDTSSLHHSVKNINYHVNPLIEIDLQKLPEGWYFKEQTESLDKKLLR